MRRILIISSLNNFFGLKFQSIFQWDSNGFLLINQFTALRKSIKPVHDDITIVYLRVFCDLTSQQWWSYGTQDSSAWWFQTVPSERQAERAIRWFSQWVPKSGKAKRSRHGVLGELNSRTRESFNVFFEAICCLATLHFLLAVAVEVLAVTAFDREAFYATKQFHWILHLVSI